VSQHVRCNDLHIRHHDRSAEDNLILATAAERACEEHLSRQLLLLLLLRHAYALSYEFTSRIEILLHMQLHRAHTHTPTRTSQVEDIFCVRCGAAAASCCLRFYLRMHFKQPVARLLCSRQRFAFATLNDLFLLQHESLCIGSGLCCRWQAAGHRSTKLQLKLQQQVLQLNLQKQESRRHYLTKVSCVANAVHSTLFILIGQSKPASSNSNSAQ
jgi:hypothetical protein